jgi:hypothetical protein
MTIITGGRGAAVVHLAVQRSGQVPYPQPCCSRAVAHGVGGQFVNGQDHVHGAVVGQPGLAGLGSHRRSHLVQRTGVEG